MLHLNQINHLCITSWNSNKYRYKIVRYETFYLLYFRGANVPSCRTGKEAWVKK